LKGADRRGQQSGGVAKWGIATKMGDQGASGISQLLGAAKLQSASGAVTHAALLPRMMHIMKL